VTDPGWRCHLGSRRMTATAGISWLYLRLGRTGITYCGSPLLMQLDGEQTNRDRCDGNELT